MCDIHVVGLADEGQEQPDVQGLAAAAWVLADEPSRGWGETKNIAADATVSFFRNSEIIFVWVRRSHNFSTSK